MGSPGSPRRRRLHSTTVIVLLVGLLASGSLSFAAWRVHQSTEDRLLKQRAREAGGSLTTLIPSLQTGLSSAAELVQATGGNASLFQRLFAPLTAPGGPFSSASIWTADDANPRMLTVLGAQPELAHESATTVQAYVNRARRAKQLAVLSMLDGPTPRVGYGVASNGTGPGFVIYAETALPYNRLNAVRTDAPFAGLDYAVYLSRTESRADLLGASTSQLPLRGRRATVTEPYGDIYLHLVVTPTHDQSGTLLRRLPWMIWIVGALISLGFALLAERLMRRRDYMEDLASELGALAEENARLYADQQTVAQTLQHSLLPDALPQFPAVEFAAFYQPGVAGIDVGGDWYDVWAIDAERVLLVVGDVSGRGLRAATIMASLRYAIRAFATEGDAPGPLLGKLGRLLDITDDGHFATVLCGEVNLATRTLMVANAGHPTPLLVHGGQAEFIETATGPPIGITQQHQYGSVTVAMPPESTLLAFTDGLFERRDEDIRDSMERLREAAGRVHQPLNLLLPRLCTEVAGDGSLDDTAILGMRWRAGGPPHS